MFRRTKETTSTGTRHGHESLGTQGWGGGRWTVGDGRWTMGDGRWAMGDGRWAVDGGGLTRHADWTGGIERGHGVCGTATDKEAERFKTENGKEATHLAAVQWPPCRPQSPPCSGHGGQ
jgi:hypothetical protein